MSEPIEIDLLLNPEPICPHCGHKDRDWWDGPQWQDEDVREEECVSCGEKYFIEASISIEFTTAKKDRDL